MNLAACAGLPLQSLAGTWFRTVKLRYLNVSLSAAHTDVIYSRFSPGPAAATPFQLLYFGEDVVVTQFESSVLLGSPAHFVPAAPGGAFVTLPFSVSLQAVADLTSAQGQRILGVSAQELTGDWTGYQMRGALTSVPQPVGTAPTQELGEALFQVPGLEGFVALSAKDPTKRTLVVLPQKLQAGSSISFSDPLAGVSFRIP